MPDIPGNLLTFLTGTLTGAREKEARGQQLQQQGFENQFRQQRFGLLQEQNERQGREFEASMAEYTKALDDAKLERDARPMALSLIARAKTDPVFRATLHDDAEAMETITRAKMQGEFIKSYPDPNRQGQGRRFMQGPGGIIYDLFAALDEKGQLVGVTPPKRGNYAEDLRKWTVIFQEGGTVEAEPAIQRAQDFLAPIYAEDPTEAPPDPKVQAEVRAGNAAAAADGEEIPDGSQLVWIPELGDYAIFDESLSLDEINAELQAQNVGRILTRIRGNQSKPVERTELPPPADRGLVGGREIPYQHSGRAAAVRRGAETLLNPPGKRYKR